MKSSIPASVPAPVGGTLPDSAEAQEVIDVVRAAEALLSRGMRDDAIRLYDQWLADSVSRLKHVVFYNRAVALSDARRLREAEADYRRALEFKPDWVEARINLGLTLEAQGRVRHAMKEWMQIAGEPTQVQVDHSESRASALKQLARVSEDLNEFMEAEDYLLRCLSINPRQPDVISHWLLLRQKQCKWPIYDAPPGVTAGNLVLAASPTTVLAESDDPCRYLLSLASQAARRFPQPPNHKNPPATQNVKRLRIGYLSAQFGAYSDGEFLCEILQAHDRSRVEVFGFCVSERDAALSANFAGVDHFERLGLLNEEQIAARISERKVDVLIDLDGLGEFSRIGVLAFRPAAFQGTWLGFSGPTNLPWIDFIVADRSVLPSSSARFFSEKPLYVDGCFLPMRGNPRVSKSGSARVHSPPGKAFVFGVLSENFKIQQCLFECWLRILKQAPNSILCLFKDNSRVAIHLRQYALQNGVEPHRLVFEDRPSPGRLADRVQGVDLVLDTFPFNGGGFSRDALEAGVPLMTIEGGMFASRVGGSLLRSLDVPELIAASMEEYEQRAVSFSRNPEELSSIRSRLKKSVESKRKTAPVFFARQLENAIFHGLEANVVSAAAKNTSPARGRPKSFLVRGWRGINHSYALVNQFQLLAMLELAEQRGVSIMHEDMGYLMPAWSPQSNGAGFSEILATKLAGIPVYRGHNPGAVLNVYSPTTLYSGPGEAVVTFMVTEFGLDPAKLMPTGVSPADFTRGRHWVVTPSLWSKTKLHRAGLDISRVVVVPHGVDASLFYPLVDEDRAVVRGQLSVGPDDFVFLNIGGAFWNKGGDLLLRAFAELRLEYSHIKLLIKDNRMLYGRSIDDTLADLGNRFPVLLSEKTRSSIVTLPGSNGIEQMRWIYSAADLYVSPYRAEGFNLPVLESLACGTPVLVTGGGATDDFFLEGWCERILSSLTSPEQIGGMVRGDFLEPDFEDLKERMRSAILRGAKKEGRDENARIAHVQAWNWSRPAQMLFDLFLQGQGTA